MPRAWMIGLFVAALVVAVAIGTAVGVLAGNRTSLTPALLPQPNPQSRVRCTSIVHEADSCTQGGIDVRPPQVGRPCVISTGVGVWIPVGPTHDDRICRR